MRLHVAALLYFLSRMAVVGFVFAVPSLYFLRGQVEVPLVVGGAVLVAALFTGYYVAAAGLRCAACSGPVLLDNGNRKHPHAQRFPGLNHRARVAWDILFGASYQCMYCNTRCRCKKNWGSNSGTPAGKQGRTFQPASRTAAASGETFPQGIFGDLTPLNEADEDPIHDGMAGNEVTGSSPVPERMVQPSYAPAAVFPDVRTVPLAVSPAPPPTSAVPVAPSAPEPPQMDILEAESVHPVPPLPFTLPKSPVPWAAPFPSESIEPASAMNRPTPEIQSVQGSNPFLAAAAAMPQPPGPMLPPIPPAPNRAPVDFRGAPEAMPFTTPEFPQPVAASPASEAPAPWTLPSMPPPAATGRVPGVIQPPVIPAAPVTAPVTTAAPATPTAPATVIPAAYSTPPASPAPSALPPDVLKDVVSVLEDGRRALTEAFQGIIDRLEARLSTVPAAAPAAAPAVAPQPVIMQAPPAPAPAVPPAPAAPVEYAIQQPPPAVLPPREKTAPLPLPPMPAAPAMHIPQPEPEAIPAAPRRKFARPSGMAAQQLSTALQDVFEAPAAPAAPAPLPTPPAPAAPAYTNGNGHPYAAPAQPVYAAQPAPQAYPAAPPASPFEMITPGQFPQHTAPVRQQSIPAAPAPSSPFAVSPTPLMSPGEPQSPPAPFTFLKNEGDHFAPMTPPPAPAGYDPLDDTPLPWMQPVGGRN